LAGAVGRVQQQRRADHNQHLRAGCHRFNQKILENTIHN
jgi:hypothetical protein